MQYAHIVRGFFISRNKRFIAEVETNGKVERVHVKNTGRCKELLIPGAEVYLDKAANPNRATRYDLVAVKKGGRLINMDATAPNFVFRELLQSGNYLDGVTLIRPEAKYGESRFDFYVEAGSRSLFIEVKGVTLEEHGAALFPDAPTLRGVKHVNELAVCVSKGYEARIVFVAQMEEVRHFTPNRKMHPAFAEALVRAKDAGVGIEAYDCIVTPDSLAIGQEIEVRL